MIAKARDRTDYDELKVGATSLDKNWYDLVVACDVFVYLGDLSIAADRVRSKIKSENNGVFALSSTELLEQRAAGDKPYELQVCARFTHKRSYVEGLLQYIISKGFTLLLYSTLDEMTSHTGTAIDHDTAQ